MKSTSSQLGRAGIIQGSYGNYGCNIPIDELTKVKIKKLMTYKPVPNNEKWRIKLVDELLGAKFGDLEIPPRKVIWFESSPV